MASRLRSLRRGTPGKSAVHFFLLLCAVGWQTSHGKEREPLPSPPPLAKSGIALAALDQPVEITLQIGGRLVEPVSFLIRKPPRQGRLGEVIRTGQRSATVIYTPDARARPGEDTFTFAVKSPDSPVSAPATVRIFLSARPAALEHASKVEFGEVFLGDQVVKTITVKNSGGTRAVIKPAINPPWKVTPASPTGIEGGGEAAFKVTFHPEEARDYVDRLRLTPDPAGSIELSGSAVSPLTWPKAGLVFSPEVRAAGPAEIVITNVTPEDREVSIEWPEGVSGIKKLTVPAGSSSPVPAEVVGRVTKVSETEAHIRSGSFSGTLPLTIFPKPAQLLISPEARIPLQKAASPDAESSGQFSIRNEGETDATVAIDTPEWLAVTPDPRHIVLEAGKDQTFQLRASPQREEAGRIAVRSPALAEARSLEVLPDGAAGKPVKTQPSAAMAPTVNPVAEHPGTKTPGQPAVLSAYLLSRSENDVQIIWKLPSPEINRFKIQRRKISTNPKGNIQLDWVDWPEAIITINGQTAQARLRGLPPGTGWTVRIMGFNAQNEPTDPSQAFQVSTMPRKLKIPIWFWPSLLLLPLAIKGILMAIRHRKELEAAEASRISALEGQPRKGTPS